MKLRQKNSNIAPKNENCHNGLRDKLVGSLLITQNARVRLPSRKKARNKNQFCKRYI